MIPCISQVTTLSTPFEVDLPAFARAGWPAVELSLTKLETFLKTRSLDEAAAILTDHGLVAAGASAQGGLLLSVGEARIAHWGHFRQRLEWLKHLSVGTMVVAVDFATDPSPADFTRAAESLSEAGRLAKDYGVRIALEFQKTARFCASLDTTLALIAQSEAANVGVCFDLFHYYTGPSKFEDLAYLSPENLFWVQVCDLAGTPREIAGDSDRILPGDGDFQLVPIFEQLKRVGFDGHVSLEVLNPSLWAVAAGALADAGLRAMARLLDAAGASNGGG
jgi:sugar phosphate isomerase/epimerase